MLWKASQWTDCFRIYIGTILSQLVMTGDCALQNEIQNKRPRRLILNAEIYKHTYDHF